MGKPSSPFVAVCGVGLGEGMMPLLGFWRFARQLPHFQSLHPFPVCNWHPPSCCSSAESQSGFVNVQEIKTSWSCPRGCLYYPHFFGFFFLVVLSGCFLLPYVSNHWFNSQLHLLYCCFPVNCSLFQSFVSDGVFFMLLRSSLRSLNILIISVLNSASGRLLISILLRFFFSWSFDLFFHLGHVSLSSHFGSLPVFVSVY